MMEFCEECGQDVSEIWTADEWTEVTGSPYGTLCIRCFNKKAAKLGYLFRWKPAVIAKGNSE